MVDVGTSRDVPPERRESVLAAAGHLLLALWRAVVQGVRRLREWNRRDGAGTSGLAQLVELHALQAAGDATVTVALANTLFFSVAKVGQARTHVALYLLITMAPFAVVAPLLGPVLDRFRGGRRIALAATMAARAVLALLIGRSLVSHQGLAALELYPAALGVLVAGKAYNVARSASVPRLVPERITLVQANSRLTFAGVAAPAIAGGFAIVVSDVLGHRNELRMGAAIYAVATILALRLPRATDGGDAPEPLSRRRARITGEVLEALRTVAFLRWLNGFLLLFGAFLVKVHPIGGLSPNVSLSALAAGIGIGNVVGIALGNRAARRPVRAVGMTMLAVSAALTLFNALDFGLVPVFAVALVSAAAAATTKLVLDSSIQRNVGEEVRTATFARSETALQLAWVAGGAVGIVLPSNATAGFAIATAVLALGVVVTLRATGSRRTTEAPAAGATG